MKTMSRSARWMCATTQAAMFMLSALPAQSTGIISGTLSDETRGVLPGVAVEATHAPTGITRSALTGADGHYRLVGLVLGSYELRASLAGFQTAVTTGVPVDIGREVVVNLVLRVGEINQEVIVEGGAALVQTTSAAVSGLVDPEQIQDLPLNGRSFADLSVLEAGVTSFKNAVASDPTSTAFGGTGVRLVFNGMRPELNNIVVDGTDAVDAFGNAPGSAAGVLLGVDTVREFSTITSNYSAEYGRAAGGVINVATRSGSNDFHGSLFWFHRNDNLDAANFFDAPINDVDGNFIKKEKPEFKRNQFGFTAGGPIVKDKTFFFGSYEGFRERLGLTSIATVPTEATRIGNLPTGPVPVNPEVEPFLALYPLPNGRDFGDGRAEYLFGTNSDTNEDFFVIKVDHYFNDSQSLFARYSFDNADKKFPALGALFGPQLFEPFLTRDSEQQLVSVEHSAALSSGALNVVRFGYNRAEQVEAQFPLNVLPGLSYLEGVQDGMGLFNVQGLSTIGGWTKPPGATLQNMFQISDDFEWTAGSHSLKTGGVYKRFHYDDNRFFQGGSFNFDCISGCAPAGPPGRTEMLAGFPVSVVKDTPDTVYDTAQRFNVFGVYVQDDWRAHPRLTLNLGLRYEMMTDPYNQLGPVNNFRDPLVDSEATIVSDTPVEVAKNNIMPRLGLAWDPFGDQKTAVRAGFGLFFQQLNEANLNFVFRLSQPPTKTILIGGPPAAGAFPVIPFPDPFRPVIVFPLEADAQNPYTMQWHFTVEREVFTGAVASVAYVGNRGLHLAAPTEINFKRRSFTQDGTPFFPPGPPIRVNPNFTAINLRDFGSDSYYHGLQIRFRKRYSQGFQVQASYTYSKTIDNSPPILRDFENSPTILFDWFQRNLDRSLSGFDVRNNFVLNFGYELPFGKSNTGAAARLVEGWQINGIVSLADGNPFTVQNSFDRTGTNAIGPFRHDRPNLKSGGDNNPGGGSPDRYFDVGAFELQPAGFFGDLGRNTVTGPGVANVDFSLFKTTQLSEGVGLQFRAEFFNIFNRANFATPTSQNRFAFVGANPNGTGIPSGSAGRLTGTVITSRQIQFALKLLF